VGGMSSASSEMLSMLRERDREGPRIPFYMSRILLAMNIGIMHNFTPTLFSMSGSSYDCCELMNLFSGWLKMS
jgi:hypothetical protein